MIRCALSDWASAQLCCAIYKLMLLDVAYGRPPRFGAAQFRNEVIRTNLRVPACSGCVRCKGAFVFTDFDLWETRHGALGVGTLECKHQSDPRAEPSRVQTRAGGPIRAATLRRVESAAQHLRSSVGNLCTTYKSKQRTRE